MSSLILSTEGCDGRNSSRTPDFEAIKNRAMWRGLEPKPRWLRTSALARFEPRVLLVDDIDTALTPDHAAGAVPSFQRF